MNRSFLLLLPVILSLFSCNRQIKKDTKVELYVQQNDWTARADSLVDSLKKRRNLIRTLTRDRFVLEESSNQEDPVINEYLTEQLKPIRKNFKRINSIQKWTTITKELWDSTEGGEATYYYSDSTLEKISTRHFGEMGQTLTEYYLLDGQLSFVFEKSIEYNRPFYYDSTDMKENNDTEAFDFKKSEIVEDRSYFEKGKLLHQLNSGDCGSPFAKDYLMKEQEEILTYFNKLIVLNKEK